MAKKKNFETALNELEDIVKHLESGDLSLEEALKKYEAGIKQSKFCQDLLNQAEEKIRVLTRDSQGDVKESQLDDQ